MERFDFSKVKLKFSGDCFELPEDANEATELRLVKEQKENEILFRKLCGEGIENEFESFKSFDAYCREKYGASFSETHENFGKYAVTLNNLRKKLKGEEEADKPQKVWYYLREDADESTRERLIKAQKENEKLYWNIGRDEYAWKNKKIKDYSSFDAYCLDKYGTTKELLDTRIVNFAQLLEEIDEKLGER